MTGLHLSHYAIEAELGRGGMGIVFRANDTKLNRTVALKVLPAGALASEDDRARFRREAQASAQLNHPNVCHVYEVDEAQPLTPQGKPVEGQTEPRLFIVMEYIAGETLHEFVKKGPLKLQEAVNIAGQIAEGLKEAHAKDIVHRDIKSANIMLTEGGVAKVLDFGLAKTNQSTMLTRMGSTLGTVAYMSPEQARGQEVDGRSDLYSLGTVLYEMVAGRLPYSGDYEQAVLYGILNEAPEPLTAVRTGVPMQLEWIVDKLLKKEAEYRYQSAAGLLADLKSLDLSGSGRTVMSMPAQTDADMTPERRAAPGLWVWGVAALTLLVGLAAGRFLWSQEVEAVPPRRLMMSFAPAENLLSTLSISADGRAIATHDADASRSSLVLAVRFLDEPAARILTRVEDFGWPSLSPSARWVAYHSDEGIMRASTDGGSPELVAEVHGTYTTWLSEDVLISNGRRSRGVFRIPIGSEPERVNLNGADSLQFVHLSAIPGTEILLAKARGDDTDQLVAIDLESGKVVRLLDRASWPRFVAPGYLLFYRNGDIFGASLDLASLEVGPTFLVQPDVDASSSERFVFFDVSPAGVMVYYPAGDQAIGDLGSRSLATGPLDGTMAPFPVDPNSWFDPRFSPDGTRLLAHGASRDGGTEIWMLNMARGTTARMTISPGEDETAVWAPGGDFFYFSSAREGNDYLVRQSVDGSVATDTLFGTDRHLHVESVSPGDDTVVVTLSHPETNIDLWLIERASGEARPLLNGPASEVAGKIHPSGSLIAFQSDVSGREEVYVAQFPGMVSIQPVSSVGGMTPVWSSDGRDLYYIEDQTLMRVDFSTGSPGAVEPVKDLGPDTYVSSPHTTFDIFGDQVALVLTNESDAEYSTPQVVTGVSELLRSLDPKNR
jgi:eukaryotic-like serine/threonine-protein kinase